MTSLWHCPTCGERTLSHLPLCIRCGPSSMGQVTPACNGAHVYAARERLKNAGHVRIERDLGDDDILLILGL